MPRFLTLSGAKLSSPSTAPWGILKLPPEVCRLFESSSRIQHRERSTFAAGDGAKNRHFTWRRRAAILVAALLALGMGYGVMFGHNGLTAYEQKRMEERRLHEQMQELQHENSRLRGHVDRLENDPGAIEHQAREELHYTRPGEVIYTLSPEHASSAKPPSPR